MNHKKNGSRTNILEEIAIFVAGASFLYLTIYLISGGMGDPAFRWVVGIYLISTFFLFYNRIKDR